MADALAARTAHLKLTLAVVCRVQPELAGSMTPSMRFFDSMVTCQATRARGPAPDVDRDERCLLASAVPR
jgi:hypothetical protein